MKKFMIIMLVPFLFACGREAKQKAVQLQARNDSLIHQSSQKDIAVKNFINSVNEVQLLLDTIKYRENIIELNTEKLGEGNMSMKARMRKDILSVYNLLLKNKNQLNILYAKLNTSGMKLAEFKSLVDHLQKDIIDNNDEMKVLQDKLAQMNIAVNSANRKIDTLNNLVQVKDQQINMQEQTINTQTTTLNTAYYIMGTNKQLTDEKIEKRGKILSDFNKSVFTKVDIRNLTEIPIDDKKIKVLSNHPGMSYKLVMDGKKVKALDITDEKNFWSNTKYLVIALY